MGKDILPEINIDMQPKIGIDKNGCVVSDTIDTLSKYLDIYSPFKNYMNITLDNNDPVYFKDTKMRGLDGYGNVIEYADEAALLFCGFRQQIALSSYEIAQFVLPVLYRSIDYKGFLWEEIDCFEKMEPVEGMSVFLKRPITIVCEYGSSIGNYIYTITRQISVMKGLDFKRI